MWLISGSPTFIDGVLSTHRPRRVIVSVLLRLCDATVRGARKDRAAAKDVIGRHKLTAVSFLDADIGGATDACFLLGFGSELGSTVLPTSPTGLRRTLRHFVDGGTSGSFPPEARVLRSDVPMIEAPPRKVLWHDGAVIGEGLFPSARPLSDVLCPSHFFPRHWVRRPLSLLERLRLHQLPLHMDPFLRELNPASGLPFADSPPPDLYVAIFRQLWEVGPGGGLLFASLSKETIPPNVQSMEVYGKSAGEGMATTEVSSEPGSDEDTLWLDTPACEMTALRLDTQGDGNLSTDRVQLFERDFGDTFIDVSQPLTDDDSTYSSEASAATIRGRTSRRNLERGSAGLEPQELEMPMYHPGPPFPVGDVILADIGGDHQLQRAFVMESNHPEYRLRLECGITVSTNIQQSWLKSRMSGMAPDRDDPFVEVRKEMEAGPHRMGSYGVHGDAQRESLRLVAEAKAYARAVKADDAEIPTHLWDDRVNAPSVSKRQKGKALSGFRKLGFRWFRRGLVEDCSKFMRSEHGKDWKERGARRDATGKLTELGRDLAAIAGMLWHAGHTTWFEFNAGSRLVHFRFPPRYRKEARDGVRPFFERPGPTTRRTQSIVEDADLRAKTMDKIDKVIRRRYLLPEGTPGVSLKSYIKYFAVPKGEDDIRMVYDATANKLNEAVWVPSFWLPSIDTLVRNVGSESWMTDRDVGDMFLNYQLHEEVRPFTAVDLSCLRAGDGPAWAVWDRNLMGFAASPYNSIKMALVAEEVCKGDRRDTRVGLDGKELNPFQWDRIELNLPGTEGYDPCVTWISKRRKDGQMACDVFTFVDDERVVGPTEDLTWQASHALASKQSYLGIQDAARKARPCSRTTGAWAGAIVHVLDKLGVCVLTSQEKWTKMKGILTKWKQRLNAKSPKLSHKELLADRGFLVYVTRTYPAMVPYLKGFHLTIEMWRGGRDAEGWKLRPGDDSSISSTTGDSVYSTFLPGEGDDDEAVASHRVATKIGAAQAYAPSSGLTSPVPRFSSDIDALIRLSDFDLPPLRVVRPAHVVHVYYGFGDASGKQFGGTISEDYNCHRRLSDTLEGKRGIRFRIGLWSALEEEESSNYKELFNLVEMVTIEARAGRLRNCEFFLFTDNSTAEGCFYRGSSKSPFLHHLVLRLRAIEMEYGMTLHVVHISGKRMIAQGTDGCSRGSLMEGVMAGADMLTFVDLGKGGMDRHPPLLEWIRAWTGEADLEPLTPEGWFEEGHGVTGGTLDGRQVWIPTHCHKEQVFLWAPPPAVADAALEELLKSRHKRSDLLHVVVIPRLMAPRWRRLFNKVCDFTCDISPGPTFWPPHMYEPLWVGIVMPFVHCRPWSLRRAPLLVEMGRDLRRVLKAGEGDGGDILRKLLNLPKRIATLPQHVACGVLHVPRINEVPDAGHSR